MTLDSRYQASPQETAGLSVQAQAPRISFWKTAFFNTAYFLFALGYSPVFIRKMKQAADASELVNQRLGKFSEDLKSKIQNKKVLWLHAVSVGEVMAVRRFLLDLLETRSEHIVLTTVTPTGQRMAKELESSRVTVLYFPFDFSFSCRRFFEALKPQALLLAETEVWPNLLIQAKKFHIPVGILNARLSEKSERRYRRFGFLFQELFRSLDFVLAQTEEDAARFSLLGVPAGRLAVLGNMKFDNVSFAARDPQSSELLKQEWGFDGQDSLWVAGSTHPREEEDRKSVV